MIETVTVLAGALVPVLAVVAAGRRVAVPRRRLAFAVAAGLVGIGALLGPMDGLAERALAGHMLQHVLIGDLAPLLFVLAVREPVLGAVLPHRAPAFAARLFRPLPAFVIWAAAVAAWHVPRLYDLALERDSVHAFEHACFVTGGVLVWTQLLDPARRRLLAGWQLFGYALLVLVASQALANVLVISYRPLYSAYADTARPFGLSQLGDQDAAGVVMMVEQLLTVGTFAFLTARRLVAAEPPSAAERHPLAA